MRATWIRTLLLLAAAAAAAVALALAAAPHGGLGAAPAPLRTPGEARRSLVQLRPEPSAKPVVRSPAPSAAVRRKAKAAAPRPHTRVRVVTVPGVVLTRVAPTRPPAQLVRAKPTKRATVTRELAALPQPEPMHDSRPRPHE